MKIKNAFHCTSITWFCCVIEKVGSYHVCKLPLFSVVVKSLNSWFHDCVLNPQKYSFILVWARFLYVDAPETVSGTLIGYFCSPIQQRICNSRHLSETQGQQQLLCGNYVCNFHDEKKFVIKKKKNQNRIWKVIFCQRNMQCLGGYFKSLIMKATGLDAWYRGKTLK